MMTIGGSDGGGATACEAATRVMSDICRLLDEFDADLSPELKCQPPIFPAPGSLHAASPEGTPGRPMGVQNAMTPFRRFIRLAIRIGIPLMMVPVATLSGTSPVRRGSFFLESADVSDWEALLPLGLFCGVATSPVLLQRANVACSVQSCRQLAIDALGMGVDEVMLQTWGEAPDAMVACALGMHEGESRIVIKVPATETGTRAAAELVSRGVRVCLTGVYAAHQALVALGLGLDYIAPHLGRMDDAGKDGPAEVEEMLAIIEGGGGSTRVVGAGLRHVDDLSSMTRLGVRTSLLRPSVARMLFELEPLTDAYAVAAEAAAKALMPPGWRRFDPSLRDASVPAARRYFRAGDNEIELITFFAGCRSLVSTHLRLDTCA